MAKRKSKRRQRHGSAWHWKQTDCWYHTSPVTKRRTLLRDDQGRPIRGLTNKPAAHLSLARLRLQRGLEPDVTPSPVSQGGDSWTVARVCSDYLLACERAAAAGRLHPEHHQGIVRYLNEFCRYVGAVPTTDLKRGDVAAWVESKPTWRSPVTRRNVLTTVLAAFQHAENEHGLRNPIKGLKKPPSRPRLQSITAEDEQLLYENSDEAFREFLFAAIHTGLRPFCELAKVTVEQVEETPRGMMWRIYSTKTKKTRKIPIRAEVARLVRRLQKSAPATSGLPIFRNAQGNPWKKVTGVSRFLKLKRLLGWSADDPRARLSCYACRHTFAHRMLSGYWNEGAGCSIEVLAELIGDTPKVAYDHYGREWGQHYQEPLWAAIGQAAPPASLAKTRRFPSRATKMPASVSDGRASP